MKIIARNKKAFFDYEILEKMEAGIVLTGDEVKSLRAGQVNLTGAFATIHKGELYLLNAHITPYACAYQKKDEATKSRKLLVHRKELNRLIGEISRKGVTLLPLSIYLNQRGKIKVELGLGKHKKAHQKKESLREKDIKRDTQRQLKDTFRY